MSLPRRRTTPDWSMSRSASRGAVWGGRSGEPGLRVTGQSCPIPYRTAPRRAGAGRWRWPRGCGVWWVWGRPLARPPVVCGGSRRAAVWLVLGGVLLSRTLAGAVPSALGVLASGFGMGPGVGSPAVTTETLCGVVCACCVPSWWHACVRVRVWVGPEDRMVDASVLGCLCGVLFVSAN